MAKVNFKDLTGKIFGKLTVINYAGQDKYHRSLWECKCECGAKIITKSKYLLSGAKTTCGKRECLISKNTYEQIKDTIIIHMSNNRIAYIDKADFEKAKPYTWSVNSNGYAVATLNHKRVYLHRVITNIPEGKEIDHINHNRLDNRSNNLRICSQFENGKNVGKHNCRQATSIYKGVYLHTQCKKYCAQIRCGNKRYSLGLYDNEKDAARAYNEAAIRLHGDYACLNSI